MKHIHFHFLEDITKNIASQIVLEVRSPEDIAYYKSLGFSEPCIHYITQVFSFKHEEREAVNTLYTQEFGAQKIYFYIPKEGGSEDRSNFIRSLKKDVLYISTDSDVEKLFEEIVLSSYTYQIYLTKKESRNVSFYIPNGLRNILPFLKKKLDLYKAIYRARDLVNEPPSVCNGNSIVKGIEAYHWKNTHIKIISKKELQKLGCNLLLAVAAGSAIPAYIVIFERTGDKNAHTYAFIGKGVTFDAGGIQIKPDKGMLDMKCDMSGAAAVIGAMQYLDAFDTLPYNIVGAIGLTENMLGENAYKPLDIYRAYNGITVEIHHTDAEGRLVLADVMSYVEDVYKPEHIITIATLTGACIYALGHDYAGIMGDDEDVIKSIIELDIPSETVWRLPINEKIKKSLKAEIADLKNISTTEKAGSSVGGAFLSYFQGKAKLTHLDIAGPAYRESAYGIMPKGGTGWGVRTLTDLVLQNPPAGKKPLARKKK